MTLGRALGCVLLFVAGLAGAEPPGDGGINQAPKRFVRELPWEEHLPDAALIDHFTARKEQFEALREMFMHDRGVEFLGRDRSEPADLKSLGVGEKRLAEYRRLLVELKIKFLHGSADRTSGMDFVMTSRGLSISGSSKGYAWLPSAPTLMAGDLDQYVARSIVQKENARSKSEQMAASAFTVYRSLGGHWYLFYSK
jgi:hypothetical protein